ncbi:hypothetical protein QTP88_003881 [Uroleucon formosanum]
MSTPLRHQVRNIDVGSSFLIPKLRQNVHFLGRDTCFPLDFEKYLESTWFVIFNECRERFSYFGLKSRTIVCPLTMYALGLLVLTVPSMNFSFPWMFLCRWYWRKTVKLCNFAFSEDQFQLPQK